MPTSGASVTCDENPSTALDEADRALHPLPAELLIISGKTAASMIQGSVSSNAAHEVLEIMPITCTLANGRASPTTGQTHSWQVDMNTTCLKL